MDGLERWRRRATLESGWQGTVLLLRSDAHGRADHHASNLFEWGAGGALQCARSSWLHQRQPPLAGGARRQAFPAARKRGKGPGATLDVVVNWPALLRR